MFLTLQYWSSFVTSDEAVLTPLMSDHVQLLSPVTEQLVT